MTFVALLALAPLVAFLLILIAPESQSRAAALVLSLVIFAASLGLLVGVPLETNLLWIPSAGIHFHLAADGLSVWLVLLSTFLTPLAVLLSWMHIDKRIKAYYSLLLLLEFGLLGVFLAMDLFLFFVFWEVSLVPMYFLIGIWGHQRRIYAAVKFFLYTMAGSALMLVGILYIYTGTHTFDYSSILQLLESGRYTLSPVEQMFLFLAFFLAFAIKVPLFPFHTWLPDAHVEAPTAGSIMLAAVMLKMGTYGLLRFCLPLFPGAARRCAGWIAVLAIIGIIYGALVAMVQPNMKKLVAYSSVSHLGFVVLGIFSFTRTGLDGAVFQMLAHGISTGALFALVGMLYERRHSLDIVDYGGVATPAPWLSTVFLITTFASAGLPLLSNFVGEFLVLQGAAQAHFPWAVYAAIGVILAACYLLWLYQRVFYGEASADLRSHMPDLTAREWSAIIPLLVMMVWLGVGSQTFLPRIGAVTGSILTKTTQNVPFQVKLTPGGFRISDFGFPKIRFHRPEFSAGADSPDIRNPKSEILLKGLASAR
jgi:NADH-quinone oxidoreductase subunit M